MSDDKTDARNDPKIDALLTDDGLSGISNAALARLMESATREYGARWQDGRAEAPYPAGSGISATDVMIVTTAMLKAVNLQPFELGMWQAWSGN